MLKDKIVPNYVIPISFFIPKYWNNFRKNTRKNGLERSTM